MFYRNLSCIRYSFILPVSITITKYNYYFSTNKLYEPNIEIDDNCF